MIRHVRQSKPVPCKTSKRKGILSMELVLTLPIFMLLLMAIFEFSFLMYARSDVVQASRAGARLATLHGVWEEEIQHEVQQSLGPRFGSSAIVETHLGEFSGEDVIVTVRVPMSAVAPNLLWPVGFNTKGRDLVAQTRMVKE